MKTTYLLFFLLGFFSCALVSLSLFDISYEVPFGNGSFRDVSAPSDWFEEENIVVFDDMVILRISNASLSSYAPTGSMKPLFDEGANGIRVVPKDESSINVGDIVSFRRDGYLIVHRVVEKSVDDEGVYFVTKGDNNSVDDGKIRFEEIEFVTVGILW